MLIESSHRGVLDAVLVMVGGMSVMDVRERPQDKQEQADQAHKKFNDEESDFLTLLHIWSAIAQFREKKKRFKRNQLRKYCKQHFLSFRRVLEWDQIVGELGRLVRDTLKVKTQALPAERQQWGDEDEMHKSLMAGVPMQFGFWDKEKRAYRSTAGREFSIFPGSGLFGNKKPEWLLGFELVETTKVWARKVASIDVGWIEEIVPHLCRYRYHSPYWDEHQGAVYGKETVICGGVTIVDGRKVFYGRVSAEDAHEVFVREAILGDGLRTRGKFLARLGEVRDEIEGAEHKLRRAGGLWSDEAVFDFFVERIPGHICTAKAFQKWRTTGSNEEKLMVTLEDCIWGEMEDLSDFPDCVHHGEFSYDVSYADNPGGKADGIIFEIGLDQLDEFPDYLIGWAVPGILEERVYLLVRALPKTQRQACSPARDVAQAFVGEWKGWEPARELKLELAEFLSKTSGHVIEPGMFDEDRLPDNMRPKLRVWNEHDEELSSGESVVDIRLKLASTIRQKRELKVNEEWEMTGGEGWDFGLIPEVAEEGVFPALVDEVESVGMRAYLDQGSADESHRAGCVRLFLIDQESHCDYVSKKFPLGMQGRLMLPLAERAEGEALEQMLRVSCEGALGTPLPRDKDHFLTASGSGKGELFACAEKVARGFEDMCDRRGRVTEWMEQHRNDRHLHVVVEDLEEEVDWLLASGFIWRAGYERFCDYGRYFEAMEERLKRLQSLPQIKDDEKRQRVQHLWRHWYLAWKENQDDDRLWPCGWMLMEWRIAEFAPSMSRKIKVSQKRIQSMMDDLDIV